MTTGTAVRIGNCSGFYGDRLSAMREMLQAAEPGTLDYLTGDYLAELTMLILGRDQLKDPALGYAKTFVQQFTDCAALAQEKQVRLVANAGGLNPAGLAAKLQDVATQQGLDLSIAYVDGDDLRARAAEFEFGDVLTANAYLGAFGIAAALRGGADVVVTGRVTDASVVVGPAIAHHGWEREDFDALAGAVAAGHVIECGTQATGGNFSGFRTIDYRQPLGFPIAEIARDGSSIITKPANTGGAVTVDTVTAQLMYEIYSPEYLNPDVTLRLDSIELSQVGPDRVAITGTRGTAPEPHTKVCLNTLSGFRNSFEFVLTGLDIEQKAAWITAQIESAAREGVSLTWHRDGTPRQDPATEVEASVLLRCDARSDNADAVGREFTDAGIAVALGSYPGFHVTRPPGRAIPVGVYRPAYVRQTDVPHRVHHSDATVEDIEAPRTIADPTALDRPAPTAAPDLAEPTMTVRLPIGAIAYARSGDKGGDANVGVWIRSDHPRRADAIAWLTGLLDESRVRELLPEAQGLEIDVWPLPNLGGVNVVLHGLLGEGVASSSRFDPQAKAVGEWLRARVIEIPKELLS